MLFELHVRTNTSNEGATSAVTWYIWFYFGVCKGLSTAKLFWIVSCILCFATGFPACLLILRMFKPRRSGTPLTPNSLFILHLTIMDTIFLTTIPFGLLNHMVFRLWVVESLWNSFYALNMCGRPLIMTCMCLDCYFAVVHPITYHKKKSLTPRTAMVCFIWASSFVYSIVFFIYQEFFLLISTVPFVITIVIVGVCDSCILHALLKSGAGKKNIHLQKKRAVQTLINSLVMTMFFYFPPILMEILGKTTMSGNNSSYCFVAFLASSLSTYGSAVMPMLFFVNRKKSGLGALCLHAL